MKSKAVNITIAVAGLTVFGAGAPASPTTTLTLCASGCDSTTIQGAVTLAGAGDMIDVAAGTYTEVVTLNKYGLLLRGPARVSTPAHAHPRKRSCSVARLRSQPRI